MVLFSTISLQQVIASVQCVINKQSIYLRVGSVCEVAVASATNLPFAQLELAHLYLTSMHSTSSSSNSKKMIHRLEIVVAKIIKVKARALAL